MVVKEGLGRLPGCSRVGPGHSAGDLAGKARLVIPGDPPVTLIGLLEPFPRLKNLFAIGARYGCVLLLRLALAVRRRRGLGLGFGMILAVRLAGQQGQGAGTDDRPRGEENGPEYPEESQRMMYRAHE